MRFDLGIAAESSQFVSAASLRLRLDWFNKLRWGAAAGVLGAILVVGVVLKIPLPLRPLLVTAGCLAVANLAYVLRNARIEPVNIGAEIRVVKLQMLVDLVGLTVLLNLSGGIENPLLFLYLIHVIIASLLFKGREIFQIAWLAIILFTGEVLGEYWGLLPHHHLLSASDMTHELPFILLTLASFWMVLLFCAYMGASIMNHNRTIKDELVIRQTELIEAGRAKVDFFRFVTHEVKSPVSTAQSAVETVLQIGNDELSPPLVDLLKRAVGRLEQATEIVKDLADLTRSRMLSRQNLQVIDLNRLVRRIVDNQTELAAQTEQTIRIDQPPQPVVLTSNLTMLEKIFGNLISNAVRYNTAGGQVVVQLSEHRKEIRFAVADQGIGIAPEDQDKIFEEFYRSTQAQERTNLGTGLGLSIVKKFVEELDGTITVSSLPGSGSTFRVVLPRLRALSQESRDQSTAADDSRTID